MSRCKACNDVFTDVELKAFKQNNDSGEYVPDDLCYRCKEYAYSKYNLTYDRDWAFGDLDMPQELHHLPQIDE